LLADTNVVAILRDDFPDTEALDGLFAGHDPEPGVYDTSTWACDDPHTDKDVPGGHETHAPGDQFGSGRPKIEEDYQRDETLQDPRTVFQILKRHYSRYTPEIDCETTGIS